MKKLSAILIVSTFPSATAGASELPAEMPYQSLHCFAGEANVIKSTEGHLVYGFHLRGIGRSKLETDILGPLSSECVGTGEVIDGNATAGGFCQFTDAEGDAFLGEFERFNANGEWRILSGSGKFETMQGGGTYIFTQHPRIAPGRFQACSDSEGTYTFQ